MKYNTDLHYHSPYAAACSKNISIPVLAKEAKIKGLNILTTADSLHPIWQKHIKEHIIEKNERLIFKEDKELTEEKQTNFIIGCEVESTKRVHHLLYFRDFETLNKFKKEILPFSQDMEKYGGGRPRISLEPDKLLDIAVDNNVLLGPAHVFTPYFGVYSHYNTLKEAYGKNYKKIKFIELGLSADTKAANTIPELENIKLFSFSDSHSPKSFRIGREYVSMELEKPNYNSFEKLLNNHKKNYILENVGYNPYEGKYNASACKKCAQIYTLKQAEVLNWKCQVCKGTIKKGVTDRAKEISIIQGNKELKEVTKRPNYRYLIPLAQVIQIAIDQKNILHKTVIEKYDEFTKNYTEIEVMQEVSKDKLEEIDKNIARYIIAFRKDFVVFRPGGAGHYGVPYICFSKEDKLKKEKEIQKEIEIKVSQTKLF